MKRKKKFRSGFLKEYKTFREYRDYIKREYGIDNQKVTVVEKRNIVVPYIKLVLYILHRVVVVILNVVLFILAAIGLTALIYPDSRQALLTVWNELFFHLEQMI